MAGTAGSGFRSNSDGERVSLDSVAALPLGARVARALPSRGSMTDMNPGRDGIAN